MRRRFATLDVFTDRRFAGNPLAVVLEGEGLDTAAMQAIAREFNHPETVFVLNPADAAHRARLRIFTPANELPFAGHPTVGTAVLLRLIDGAAGTRAIIVEEGIGPVHCLVDVTDAAHGTARFTVPRLPAEAGAAPDAAAIAPALGLDAADIGFDGFAPSRWSAGVAFTFVPVRSLAALARAWPDAGRFEAVFGGSEPGKAYLFCAETAEAGHDFHARMFAPKMGIAEDPATGSAAAAFAGLLAAHDAGGDGDRAVRIEQGYEMGRPSLVTVAMTMQRGRLVAASISGDAVVITEGTIEA
jgi:trans-2,3-dihydro-3-hydroxyanthranilate isomerase